MPAQPLKSPSSSANRFEEYNYSLQSFDESAQQDIFKKIVEDEFTRAGIPQLASQVVDLRHNSKIFLEAEACLDYIKGYSKKTSAALSTENTSSCYTSETGVAMAELQGVYYNPSDVDIEGLGNVSDDAIDAEAELKTRIDGVLSAIQTQKGSGILSSQELYVVSESIEAMGLPSVAHEYQLRAEKAPDPVVDTLVESSRVKKSGVEALYLNSLRAIAPQYDEYSELVNSTTGISTVIDAAEHELEGLQKIIPALNGRQDAEILQTLMDSQLVEVNEESLDAYIEMSLIYEGLGYLSDEEIGERWGEDFGTEGYPDRYALADALTEVANELKGQIALLKKDQSDKKARLEEIEPKFIQDYTTTQQLATSWIEMDLIGRGIHLQDSAAAKRSVSESMQALQAMRAGASSNETFSQPTSLDYAHYAKILAQNGFKELAIDMYKEAAEVSVTGIDRGLYMTEMMSLKDHNMNDIIVSERYLAAAKEGDPLSMIEFDGISLPVGDSSQLPLLEAKLYVLKFKELLKNSTTAEESFETLEKKILDSIVSRTGKAGSEEVVTYGQAVKLIVFRHVGPGGKIFKAFAGLNKKEDETRTNEEMGQEAFKETEGFITAYDAMFAPFASIDGNDPFTQISLDIKSDYYFFGYSFGLGRPQEGLQAIAELQDKFPDSSAIRHKVRQLKNDFPQIATAGEVNSNIFLADTSSASDASRLMLVNDEIKDASETEAHAKAFGCGAVITLSGGSMLPVMLVGALVGSNSYDLSAEYYATSSQQSAQAASTGISPVNTVMAGNFADEHKTHVYIEAAVDGLLWGPLGSSVVGLSSMLLLGIERDAIGGLVGLSLKLPRFVSQLSPATVRAMVTAGYQSLRQRTSGIISGIQAVSIRHPLEAAKAVQRSWRAFRGSYLGKFLLGKPGRNRPLPDDFRKGVWRRIANYLGWYRIDPKTGEYIFTQPLTGERYIFDGENFVKLVRNPSPIPITTKVEIDALCLEKIGSWDIGQTLYVSKRTGDRYILDSTVAGASKKVPAYFKLETGPAIGGEEISLLELSQKDILRKVQSTHDVLMSDAEANSVWLLIAGMLGQNGSKEGDDWGWRFLTGSGLLLFFNRLSIERFKLSKGGQRGLWWLDRAGDAYLQITSGQPIEELDMERLAVYFGTGTVVGQARGKWLMRALATKSGSGFFDFAAKKNLGGKVIDDLGLLKAVSISTEMVDNIPTSYGSYVKKTPFKSQKLVMAPSAKGTIPFGAPERTLLAKLLNWSNGNLTLWIDKAGKIYSRGVGEAFLGRPTTLTKHHLNSKDRSVLASILSKGMTKDLSTLFGTTQTKLKLRIDPQLNARGLVSFCAIHDLIIGTLWDGFRIGALMGGNFWTSAEWTLAKSLTTLPPQNWWKLRYGWDSPMATMPPRLIGRDLIDLVMTRSFPLWEGKGLFTYGYKENLSEVSNLEDFLDLHVGPKFYNSGGLTRYTLATYAVAPSPWSRFDPIGSQHSRLAELYSGDKIDGKKILPAEDLLLPEDMEKIDSYLNELLDKAVAGELNFDYTDEEASLEIGALLVVAAYVRRSKKHLFPASYSNHADLFEQADMLINVHYASAKKSASGIIINPLSITNGQDASLKTASAKAIESLSSGEAHFSFMPRDSLNGFPYSVFQP